MRTDLNNIRHNIFLIFFLVSLFCLFPGLLSADSEAVISSASKAEADDQDIFFKSDKPVQAEADRMEYNKDTGWIEAIGNAVINHGNETLKADYVRLNTVSGESYASGNVRVLFENGDKWTGEKLKYNYKEKKGEIPDPEIEMGPFRVLESDKAEQMDANTFVLHNATITTCTNEPSHTHYRVKAGKLTIVPGHHMITRHAVWYLGKVPVMYLPYWYRRLNDRGLRLSAGQTTDLGVFLLSSYRYYVNDYLESEPHLDYYSKRGLGIGEDLRWKNKGSDGQFSGYYINDRDPDSGGEGEDIDSQRYRIRIKHRASPGASDYFLGQVHYLSDRNILKDFFKSEYEKAAQPENYLWYNYRGDDYTASVMTRIRLNDFYDHVNRLPEGSVDFFKREIRDLSFYYESENSAGYLQKQWSKDSSNDEYSALRVDSDHTFSYIEKLFGFLRVIPRAGYRGTFYSKTFDTRTITTGTGTNTTQITENIERGSKFRSIVELGQTVSYKAYKVLEKDRLRHVIEPYSDYTYIPEPSVAKENIYQFDRVDALDKSHQIQIGMRNKFQSKKGSTPYNILDIDTYTIYRLEKPDDEPALKNVWVDADLTPTERTSVRFDGVWDLEETRIQSFNTQVDYKGIDQTWSVGAEYRYTYDRRSLLSSVVTLWPEARWSMEFDGRYNLYDSRIEEQWVYLQRNLDCMGIRGGFGVEPGYTADSGNEKEDEFMVLVELWLTAFPETSIAGRVN